MKIVLFILVLAIGFSVWAADKHQGPNRPGTKSRSAKVAPEPTATVDPADVNTALQSMQAFEQASRQQRPRAVGERKPEEQSLFFGQSAK